ncbi:hypothetical protein PVL29_005853 [Vitis rotundifolia]|uniref:HMA domain-containing protein n=1 Tax=Vitis rotundifolia TaxID=103349 RepID=A0AA39A4B8_VITRO|nr:hypothetical protein PVL29_005853 [Vitis rotundifolia]
MSKEEFLKIQTCVLKVNIHCDGCKHKVKKILHKIEGVYTTKIDADLGKVTVSGNVDAATLMKKLNKAGKHAELWGAPKANNQNQLNNQLKNLHLDNGGKGGNKKGGNNNGGNQPKGGQPNPQQQLQQLQQQMKGFQDLKLPQFKDLKMPFKDPGQAPKAVRFNLPEDDGIMSDDEFDDEFDDEDFEDDEFDDELDDIPHQPPNKMKPNAVNGQGTQMPNLMMLNGMMNGQQMMNAQAMMNAQKAGGNGGNGKKGGGGGAVPIQINGNDGKNGGKKGGGGGNNNGGNQNQGGGGGKNGGKNGGGAPSEGKNGNNGGGGNNKNGNNGGGGNGNGGKKGGAANDGVHAMNNMPNAMHNMAAIRGLGGGNMGQMPMGPMGNMPMGQMGNMPMGQMGNMPMAQMGNNMPAVQGLPAGAINAGAAGGGVPPGYFQGAGPEVMAGNPYYQQHLAAMVMNQQRAHGNERFQPMMYARPPPAVNYLPPYPHQPDPYTHFFSDENTSSCNVM